MVKRKSMSRLCALAILILSIAGFIAGEACRTKIDLVYIGKDRVIQQLENGNYEVSPELVILYRKYKQYWEEHHEEGGGW